MAERGHPSPTLLAPGLPKVQGPLRFIFSVSIIHTPLFTFLSLQFSFSCIHNVVQFTTLILEHSHPPKGNPIPINIHSPVPSLWPYLVLEVEQPETTPDPSPGTPAPPALWCLPQSPAWVLRPLLSPPAPLLGQPHPLPPLSMVGRCPQSCLQPALL